MDKYREMYLSMGICPICKKNQVEPHKKACLECLGMERDRYQKQREAGTYNKQKADTERKRIKRAERLEKGLCPRCGKAPAIDRGLCKRCRAYQKRYRDSHRGDITRSERAVYGRCYICGKEELYEDKKVCKECYETRLATIPSMLANPNREYFSGLNSLVFQKKKQEA